MKVVRVSTGPDQRSHVEDLEVPLTPGRHGDQVSERVAATGVIFRETPAGVSLDFHNAPRRQFVVTLSGQVEIEGPRRSLFILRPDDLDPGQWQKR